MDAAASATKEADMAGSVSGEERGQSQATESVQAGQMGADGATTGAVRLGRPRLVAAANAGKNTQSNRTDNQKASLSSHVSSGATRGGARQKSGGVNSRKSVFYRLPKK